MAAEDKSLHYVFILASKTCVKFTNCDGVTPDTWATDDENKPISCRKGFSSSENCLQSGKSDYVMRIFDEITDREVESVLEKRNHQLQLFGFVKNMVNLDEKYADLEINLRAIQKRA